MRVWKLGRSIEGISAVLLPMRDGRILWDDYAELLSRTVESGITPAVNMDTGYANLLTEAQRSEVLRYAADLLGGQRFVAGAFAEGSEDPQRAYERAVDQSVGLGGTPIVFPSSWLKALPRSQKLATLASLAERSQGLILFELGEMFVPFGEIWDIDFLGEVMAIPTVLGVKHSSLRRDLEWQRLDLRDRVRPDFNVYTGNDLAIDMVMWGSDYLLGLSAFHAEAFALRDAWWAAQDERFFELNDALQALGAFTFRPPVPAYKHSCAQFLKLRGRITSHEPHPKGLHRPASDVEVLQTLLARIEEAMER